VRLPALCLALDQVVAFDLLSIGQSKAIGHFAFDYSVAETSQMTSAEVFLFHARSVIWITFWDMRRTPGDCWAEARHQRRKQEPTAVVCYGSCLPHTATARRG
jgi:hypothetical protein